MDKKETMHMVQEKARGIFTPARLKKAGGCLLICAILAGGGAWYHHQQKQTEHAQVLQAKTTMIEAQAARNNIAILDTNTIRSLTAEAIGIDENNITYREISLSDKALHDNDKLKDHDKDKHKDKDKDKDKNKKSGEHEYSHPSSSDYNALAVQQTDTADNAAAPSARQQAPAFQPIYKVACKANNVKYDLRIDAVTGQILRSSVD